MSPNDPKPRDPSTLLTRARILHATLRERFGLSSGAAYRQLADALYAALRAAAEDGAPRFARPSKNAGGYANRQAKGLNESRGEAEESPAPRREEEGEAPETGTPEAGLEAIASMSRDWLDGYVFDGRENEGEKYADGVIGPEYLGALAESLGYADAPEPSAKAGKPAKVAQTGRRGAGAWYTPWAERLLIFRLALADFLAAHPSPGLARRTAADWLDWIGDDHEKTNQADEADEVDEYDEYDEHGDLFQSIPAPGPASGEDGESPPAAGPPAPADDFDIDGAAALAALLRGLRIWDPACGAGGFLLTAGRELRRLLARLEACPSTKNTGRPKKEFAPFDGIGRLHGDDIEPAALQAAARRLALAFGDAPARAALARAPAREIDAPPPNGPGAEGEAGMESAAAAHTAWWSGCGARLAWNDALTRDDDARYDLVIGNPPYVQYKRIHPPRAPSPFGPPAASAAGKKTAAKTKTAKPCPTDAAAYRRLLAQRVRAADPEYWTSAALSAATSAGLFAATAPVAPVATPLDGRADLYLYFHFLGFARLAPGGVLALVTSEAWLDVDGGRAWQAYWLARARARRVVAPARRQSFADADVNTVLLFAQKPRDAAARAGVFDEAVLFAQLAAPFSAALSPEKWRACLAATGPVGNVEGDAEKEAAPSPAGDDPAWLAVAPRTLWGSRASAGSAPATPFAGGKWGGRYLRGAQEGGAASWWRSLPEAARSRCRPLGEWARIATGIKQGGYGRYIQTRPRPASGQSAVAAFNGPEAPDTSDASGVDVAGGLSISPAPGPGILKDPRRHGRVLLDAPDAWLLPDEAGPAVMAKAARGGAPLLWLAGRGATHKVWSNPDRLAHTGNFIGVEPGRARDGPWLLAALNSLWTALASELHCRGKGIGGGACVFSAGDLRSTPVPEPGGFDAGVREELLRRARSMASWAFVPLPTRALALAGSFASETSELSGAPAVAGCAAAMDSPPPDAGAKGVDAPSLAAWTAFDRLMLEGMGLDAAAIRALCAAMIRQLERRRRKADKRAKRRHGESRV